MTLPLLQQTALQEAFTALRQDLIHPDGPRISTMRNYRFAIVQYAPTDEFRGGSANSDRTISGISA